MNISVKLNDNFKLLKQNYLFSEVGKRVAAYRAENPNADIIRLGIGDVTLPLPEVIVDAMKKACDEMGKAETFKGYPPEYGYDFLREAISNKYKKAGISVDADEIIVSDGAKSDVGNISELFGITDVVIPDPVYPVYLDSNLMAGRKITLLDGNEENNFLPTPESLPEKPYTIYICSPGNPTGSAYDVNGLEKWVNFANKTGSVIIYDAAYESFVKTKNCPRSIFEIKNARNCAVEICSFSKFAGFTGVRCSWSVFPKESCLQSMWKRRQATKFNGVPYIVQKAAEAALSDEGEKACKENLDYYCRNASLIASCMKSHGIWFTGGIDSPYIWFKCPKNLGSWEFFDMLLKTANVVGTPGEGFGECGKGYFRLTSFASYEKTVEAVSRMDKLFNNL